MIIDGHCHIGELPGVPPFTGEDLAKKMEEDGIDMTIAFTNPFNLDNEYSAKVMKKFPNKVIGFAFINPRLKTAVDQLKRAIEVLGLKGMKLHPFLNGYALSSHEHLDPLFEVCVDADLPIIVHGGDDLFTHPYEFDEMARTFPEAKLIMAHMGFMWTCDQARAVAKRRENVYVDTAAVAAAEITLAVEIAGANKIVMGSDNPYWSPKLEVEKIKMAVPDPSKRELILAENYRKLLKL